MGLWKSCRRFGRNVRPERARSPLHDQGTSSLPSIAPILAYQKAVRQSHLARSGQRKREVFPIESACSKTIPGCSPTLRGRNSVPERITSPVAERHFYPLLRCGRQFNRLERKRSACRPVLKSSDNRPLGNLRIENERTAKDPTYARSGEVHPLDRVFHRPLGFRRESARDSASATGPWSWQPETAGLARSPKCVACNAVAFRSFILRSPTTGSWKSST